MSPSPTNVESGNANMPPPKHSDAAGLSEDKCMPIAIIGMGFRGPADATDVNSLWKMLLEKREGYSPIPKKRWNNDAFYHPDYARHGAINVQGGHFLTEDVDLFDAPFFNMTSDEAASMDPQQRILLEVTYEALENAGIQLPEITGSNTSCFVGSFNADYTDLLLRDPEFVSMYQCTNAGQSRAMTANRLSYFFDFRGPSVTVDTACSGSLVALHLACQSLRSGDASMAVAAGVNLVLSHEFMTTMSMMKFLSPDGRCHTFDENANGYARGEAIGSLLLKPLEDAIRDNDVIRAVIRGTGSNQDGKTPGITLPSGAAQETLFRHVYNAAGLDPRETEFVETHGTGTQAGDPIETGALSKVFSPGRPEDVPLRIGSIKSNVGHLEGTSGIAGVIKAALMLENRLFLPNRNLETINPRIQLEDWNLKVQVNAEPWESAGPHRVSVNSFGYGGSNAHAILEDIQGYASTRGLREAPRVPRSAPNITHVNEKLNDTQQASNRTRIFTLSSFDEASCKNQIQKLRQYLIEKQPSIDDDFMNSLAFTLNERRTNLAWKAAVTGDSAENVARSLETSIKPKRVGKKPNIGFVFTGQGAQWSGMGKELLGTYPVFRDSMNRVNSHLAKIGAPFDLYEEILRSKETSRLSHPLHSQPICTAIQISLVDLLASWGVLPDSVTGHSSGEIAAAYAIGALSLEDAMSIAYYRGTAACKLQASTDGKYRGSMMAAGISAEDAQPFLAGLESGKAVVACINSPSSITISGDYTAIEELENTFRDKEIFSRRLAVEVAYHSHHMKAIAHDYFASIASVTPRTESDTVPRKKPMLFFSSVTGKEIKAPDLGPQYWVSNLLNQVKFADSVKTLCFETGNLINTSGGTNTKRQKRAGAARKASIDLLIEIGPHSALAGPIKQILSADPKLNVAEIMYSTALARYKNAATSTLNLVVTLAMAGYDSLNFPAINRPAEAGHEQEVQLLVDLPPYTWNHSRSFWAESRISKMYRNRKHPRRDLLGVPDRLACPFEPRWRNYLRISEIPWLEDHKIQSNIVYPAAGYIAMAIEAVFQHVVENNSDRGVAGYHLQDIAIKSALVINETSAAEVMISLQESESSHLESLETKYLFRVYSITEENRWTEHCKGYIEVEYAATPSKETNSERLEDAINRTFDTSITKFHEIDVQPFYEKLAAAGLEYGGCFANLIAARFAGRTCIAEIANPDTAAVMPMNFQYPFLIHPCTLDSVFHTVFVGLSESMGSDFEPPIPVSIDELYISNNINSEPGHRMGIQTSVRNGGRRGDIHASIAVSDTNEYQSNEGGSVALISGLTCRTLARDVARPKRKQPNRIAYTFEWNVDPDLLAAENASRVFNITEANSARWKSQEAQEKNLLYERSAVYYIKKALKSMESVDTTKLEPHLKRQLSFFADVNQQYEGTDDNFFDTIERVRSAGVRGEILSAVGENLPALLTKEADITTVVRDNDKTEAYWKDVLYSAEAYEVACRYLDMVSHKNPMISVLDIGSGIGEGSSRFLEQLSAHNGEAPRCKEYTITSLNQSSFDNVARRYEKWSDWTGFKQLDVEGDLESQGFQPSQYDVVIVPQGIYMASSTQKVLSNFRTLLKPGGSLILVDAIPGKGGLVEDVVFGHFPGWRDSSTYGFSQGQWNDALLASNFTGAEIFVGCKDQVSSKECSVVISRAQGASSHLKTDVLIVTEDKGCGVSVEYLQELLSQNSLNTEVTTFAQARPAGRLCIVLSDLVSPLLAHPSGETFDILKQIFLQSASVLWVSRGGAASTSGNPDASIVLGFARTARSEGGVDPIVTLDLDDNNRLSDERAARIIFDLVQYRFTNRSADLDTEFAERDGVLHIPRVVGRREVDEAITALQDDRAVSDQLFQQSDLPLLAVSGDGAMDDGSELVQFATNSKTPKLPPGHVGIQVKAIGLNEPDAYIVSGQAQPGTKAGSECSGIVYAVGDGVNHFAIGDRVACLGTGTATNIYHDHVSVFQELPDDMSFDVAAALPVAYSTGFHVVHNLAHISSDDKVLIHEAAKPSGMAIIDICLLKGADVFATVTTPDQKDLISTRYSIPENQIFIENEGFLPKSIIELTGNKGADVTINSSSDLKVLRQLWDCTASYGRFIQLGTENISRLQMNLKKNILFAAFDLPSLMKEKPDVVVKIWRDVLSLFHAGALRGPSALSNYKIPNIGDALQAIGTGEHLTENVVVTVGPNDTVKANIQKKEHSLLQSDASYMLVGGLGGIGRVTALWMIEHGAKHLIFANRSGMASEAAKETVKLLEQKGVNVIVQPCDISDAGQVQKMVENLQEVAPPIRGVIQAAMVLKDIHIEQMTADDYNRVLQPKYAGTWNLHRYLPQHLDFFIMLSSIIGLLGNATQAAYAAGSSFMDAFAAYRSNLGLRTVSLDLGVITDAGYLAQNKELAAKMSQQGFQGTDTKTLMSLVETAIATTTAEAQRSQIITGLGEYKEGQSLGNLDSPIFAQFRRQFLLDPKHSQTGQQNGTSPDSTLREDLKSAKSIDEASGIIYNALSSKFAAHLSIPVDEIDPAKAIPELGVDSHVAVELRNWISKKMESTVPILEVLASGSLGELAGKIAGKSLLVNVPGES